MFALAELAMMWLCMFRASAWSNVWCQHWPDMSQCVQHQLLTWCVDGCVGSAGDDECSDMCQCIVKCVIPWTDRINNMCCTIDIADVYVYQIEYYVCVTICVCVRVLQCVCTLMLLCIILYRYAVMYREPVSAECVYIVHECRLLHEHCWYPECS